MKPEAITPYRRFRPTWRAFSVYFLGVVIFGLGPEVNPQAPISPALSHLIASLFLAFILVKRFGSEYFLNEESIRAVTSFPTSRDRSLPVKEINRIDLRRGISQRLLRVAHVHIYRQNQAEPVVKLFGVPDPEVFRKVLLDLGAGDQQVYGAWRK